MHRTVFLVAGLVLAGTPLLAQAPAGPPYQRHVPALLAREARVSEDSARAVAARRVPLGTLRAVELERERGRLIYSMEFTVPRRTGTDEVTIDASTGATLGVEHESPEQERKERTSREP